MLRSLSLALAALAMLSVGACREEERPDLMLQAVLAQSDTTVSDRIDWFVERDDAWLGPDVGTTLEAVPGLYTAKLDVLGSEPVTQEVRIAEDAKDGAVLRVDLDASLVEIALAPESQSARIAFEFQSVVTMGSAGVRLSEDGTVRTLVSRDLSELILVIDERRVPIAADFAAGTVLRLVEDGGTLRPMEE